MIDTRQIPTSNCEDLTNKPCKDILTTYIGPRSSITGKEAKRRKALTKMAKNSKRRNRK